MDNEKKDEVSIDLEEIKITGKITIKEVTSSTEEIKTPMDVVFVLDTSGSMQGNNAKNMINAVNSSIKTIMSKNADSRIGVVGFSGKSGNSITNSSTIISLNKYGTNIDYLELKDNTIKSKVTNNSRNINGGTNTQSGIKAGAEMLIGAMNKQYETTINGKKVIVTRTPVLILVTDGEPTYYYANETATEPRIGDGGAYINADENYYYWTIRTAKYYKDQITNKYYQNTDKTAKVFTIGIGLSGNEAVAMLDPTEKNVNACNNNNSQQKALYKLITNNGKVAPGAYSYANGSKTGKIEESDLTGFLNTSIDSSTDNEKNRAITTEESKARRVELGTINEEKEFSLTVGTDSYTSLNAAMKAGYVKKATSTTYYLDLSEISRSTNVEIVYWN